MNLKYIITSNSLKYFFNFIAVIIVIFSFVSLVAFKETKQELLEISIQSDVSEVKELAQNITKFIKQNIGTNLYEDLQKDRELRERLERTLEIFITDKYKYIYLVGPKSEQEQHFYFLLDGSLDDKSEFGEIYTPFDLEEWKKLYKEKKGRYFEHKELESLWITYLEPIIINEKIAAILVIDFSASKRQKIETALHSLTTLSLNVFFVFSIFFILVLILSYVDAKRQKEKELAYEKLQHLNEKLEDDIQTAIAKAREKEELLQQQSRLAQMGEMINMIAHQWRQPLTSISSATIALRLRLDPKRVNCENKEEKEKFFKFLSKKLSNVEDYTQILSSTIDDFRSFFKQDKQKKKISILKPIERSLFIVEASLKTQNIELIKDFKTACEIEVYPNEIMQVILNIIKNAQDNFQETGVENAKIVIETKETENEVIIEICDNGGGIDKKIINRIFEPYFSTKKEKNGTGLGLYMSKMMIEEHNNGKLSIQNREYGACFIIQLTKEGYTYEA